VDLPQRTGGSGRIPGIADRPDHGDPLGAGRTDRAHILGVDAADREERDPGVGGGVAHQLQADRGVAGFGRRRKNRADPDVVDAAGVVDLVWRMRRKADQSVASDDLARGGNRPVVLPDVYAVGPTRGREAGIVVDNEERSGRVARGSGAVGGATQLRARGVLVAQLQDVDLLERRSVEAGDVTDQVQAGRLKPDRAVAGHGEEVWQHQGVSERDLIVIGGGAIGLTVAWRAAQRGLRVTVLERAALGAGASQVAAGMLAPAAEAEFGAAGRRLLELGLESARRWPSFASALGKASGLAPRLRHDGTLMVARDRDEADALDRELEYRRGLGLNVERLRPSEARRLEPGLAPTVRLALSLPEESTVDPRWLLDALAVAGRLAGAELREHAAVECLSGDGDGVVLAGGERLGAERVVVAAGAWSAGFGAVAVRPVKGQVMRLRDPRGPGLVGRVVRFDGGYLVPRGDGQYVLGASVEERGFDVTVTARAVHELLRDAVELVPGVLELELEDVRAGLRPGTPDNLPVIGAARPGGPIWATGHYRNGILLAPLTADMVMSVLDGEPLDRLASMCAPERRSGAVA
jgi:glycine oxidase